MFALAAAARRRCQVFMRHSNHRQYDKTSVRKRVGGPIALAVVLGLALCPVPTRAAAEGACELAVLVLPFAELNKDADHGLGAWLTHDICLHLGREAHLTVRLAAPGTSLGKLDHKDLGAAHGAQVVLEGSVRVRAGRIRASVQLVRTPDGHHLWGETYTWPEAGRAELPADIARDVVEALRC